jgi:hypothetical protein
MPKTNQSPEDYEIELLEKILIFQMFSLGATQRKIVEVLGKRDAYVNSLLKGISRGGKSSIVPTSKITKTDLSQN